MELRRAYSTQDPQETQESSVRYWAKQAVALCSDIDDESLNEHILPVYEAVHNLNHDRRIIVFGGEKCGKSTLLAALADIPTIAHSRPEGEYVRWRALSQDGDTTCSRFLPLPELVGLELVDTAPCTTEAMQETCRALIERADIAIGVLDGRKGDNACVWDVLASLPQPQLDICLLVVTYTDQMGAENSVMIKENLRHICQSKLGRVLPFYLTSPNRKSSLKPFRSRVQDILRERPTLRRDILALAESASDLVDKQSRILIARRSASNTDNSFIAGINQQIDQFLTNQMLGLKTLQTNLSTALLRSILPVQQEIRYFFGWALSPSTLLRLELMGADTDRALYNKMEEEVQHMQQESDKQFTIYCAGHWGRVRPLMKKNLECEIGDFPEAKLSAELQELRKRLCRDIYGPFVHTGLRHNLFHLYISQAGWMRACLMFMCFLLVSAGGLGFFGHDTLGMCCVVAAVLVWVVGSIAHYITCQHICEEFSKLTAKLREALDNTMASVLEQLIISRVTAYRQLYDAPQQKVARQDEMLEPLQKRQKDIQFQLRNAIHHLKRNFSH